MNHFGVLVIGLLAAQVGTAWKISALANDFLEGERLFYFAICVVLTLAIDAGVWLSHRGNLSNAFHVPGAVLLLLATVPLMVLHLREVILAL